MNFPLTNDLNCGNIILVMESGGFLFMNNTGVSKAEGSLTASLYNCLKAPFFIGG